MTTPVFTSTLITDGEGRPASAIACPITNASGTQVTFYADASGIPTTPPPPYTTSDGLLQVWLLPGSYTVTPAGLDPFTLVVPLTISGNIRNVDLGVINFGAIFEGGQQLLYTMQPGEFLSTIRVTDTDAEEFTDGLGNLQVGIGTVKSFNWYAFAWWRTDGSFFDTLAAAANTYAYGPYAATFGTGTQGTDSMVLSAAAAGDIYAALFQPTMTGPELGSGVRYEAVGAWQANHDYGAQGTAFNGAGVIIDGLVVANGTVWRNTGAAGTSGGSSPDFAGNAGGTVSDGADIVWTDTNEAPPTTGTVHVVAEIWKL